MKHITFVMSPKAIGRLATPLVVVCLVWVPRLLCAQIVQGHVIDSTSGMPVTRGFVVLLNPMGSEVVRSLSNADGRFTLRAPAPGSYQIRSERIGFRASESEFFSLSEGETLDFTLRVAALPVRLEAVVVAGPGRCNANPAEGANTVLVWEEIRKALAAAAWGDEQELFHYRQYTYRRDMNERRDRKIEETLMTRSGVADPPFRSVPAEQLARDGYITERQDGTWYYLPDAQTLLDDDFLSTHCFHVVRDGGERPGQVGLAFEPMADRTLPDVEGVLWLDEESSELRELVVRHTRVSYNVTDRRIGGNVRLLMLPSGAWIVREWQVRTPWIDVTENPRYARGYRGEVVGFTDTGGEVFAVSSLDGTTVYEGPVATVIGSVFDSTSSAPLRGAIVSVVNSDFRTVTDSAGLFELDVPLEGDYAIELEHPHLDSVAAEAQGAMLELRRGTTTHAAFSIPHLTSAMRRICKGRARSADSRMVFGVVRASGNAGPTAGASVSASWQTFRLQSIGRGRQRQAGVSAELSQGPGINVSVRDMVEQVTTDQSGFYAVCDIPPDRPVRLSAEKEGSFSREASVAFEERRGGVIQFAWDRMAGGLWEQEYETPQPAWKIDLVIGALHRVAAHPLSPVFYGTVTDSTSGEPLAGVTVTVNEDHSALTDADGRYRLAGVDWRESGNRVEVRSPGYLPKVFLVQIEGAENEVLLHVSLLRQVQLR